MNFDKIPVRELLADLFAPDVVLALRTFVTVTGLINAVSGDVSSWAANHLEKWEGRL